MRKLKLFIAMLCLAFFLSSAKAYSGYDYTTNPSVADTLSGILNGSIGIFDSENGYPVGSSIGSGQHQFGGTYGWTCWAYANAVYYRLFGVIPDRSASNAVNLIGTVSYSSLASAGVKCGTYMRTESSTQGGHSIILLAYSPSNIVWVDANWNSDGKIIVHSESYSYFNTYYINFKGRTLTKVVIPSYTDYEEPYSSLQFKNVTCPNTWVIKAAGWDLSGGTLVSDAELTAIRSEIIRASDGYVVSDSGFKEISGHCYAVKSLDDYSGTNNGVRFSYIHTQGLGEGTYIWRLTGRDSWGRNIVLPMPFTATYSGSDSNRTAEYPGPAKASVSVVPNDDMHETAINWNVTSNTSYYDLRIWKSDGTMEYGRQNFSIASSPNALVILDAGSYTANVASVNTEDGNGTWVYSDTVSFTVPEAARPEGAMSVNQKEYNQTLYKLYQKDCTWREAKYIAEQSGGTFAAITTQEEQDVVSQMVSDGGFNAWIGAEAYHGYTWSWVSGEPWNYTNWASGEPNGSNGKENCAEIYASTGEWNDVAASSDHVHGFVVEFKPVSVTAHWKREWLVSEDITEDNIIVNVTYADGTELITDDYTLTIVGEPDNYRELIIRYANLTALLEIPSLTPDCVLPDSLTGIDAEAFCGSGFQYVRLPEKVKAIGSRAFADCQNLRHIYIPAMTADIAPDAFDNVEELTIHGAKNSYAEQYAEEHGFGFVSE